jgi:hypothetical protein
VPTVPDPAAVLTFAGRTILSVRVRAGAFRAAIIQPGNYHAVFRGAAGPTVRIR